MCIRDRSLEAADYITEICDAQKISLDAQSGDVKITKAGTYQLSGTLKNGSVIVDAKDAVVRIVLNNACLLYTSGFCSLRMAFTV